MSEGEFDSIDVDADLEELRTKADELGDRGLYRSKMRVLQEIRRLSKSEQRLIPYLHASFSILCCASDCLQPGLRRETALEVISFLESEDRARSFQSDVDDEHYAYTQRWMTACGYDNLAIAVGEMKGYNSPGMQQCISDGIAVCHRTGKVECVTCFRAYASDVYTAADDVELALRFAKVEQKRAGSGEERHQYTGELKQARLFILSGELERAWEAAIRTWNLRGVHHNPYEAEWSVMNLCREISLLLNDSERYQQMFDGYETMERPVPGEDSLHDLSDALLESLELVNSKRYDEGVKILTEWDRRLQEQEYQHRWFEVRLRILAAYRLSGRGLEIERLAASMKQKATESNDWLTLRLLERIQDPNAEILAVPMTKDPTKRDRPSSLQDAETQKGASDSQVIAAGSSASVTNKAIGETPSELVSGLMNKLSGLYGLEDPVEISKLLSDVVEETLGVGPEQDLNPDDTGRLIGFVNKMSGMFIEDEDYERVWDWANRLSERHRDQAIVLNAISSLGWSLIRNPDSPLKGRITDEEIETGFRRSLESAPNAAGCHMRAGEYFLEKGEFGEAERCLARAFRFLRDNSELATMLSDVYRRTDRSGDALEVLDIAIREGCNDPSMLFNAAILARGEKEAELSLTYLDQLEEEAEGEPWVQYYRGLALLDLGRHEEVLIAAKKEREQNEEGGYPSLYLEAIAQTFLKSAEKDEVVEKVLSVRPSSIEVINPQGLASLTEYLWKAARSTGDVELVARVEKRLLETGLASKELFQAHRDEGEVVEDLKFYRVLIRQPLDESWQKSHAALAGEEEWNSYLCQWGVLSTSEDDAVELVFDWQLKAFGLPAEILEIEATEGTYHDVPGVIWQGERGEPRDADEQMSLGDPEEE